MGFKDAVKKAYPLHYFLLDWHKMDKLRKMYNEGLEDAAQVAEHYDEQAVADKIRKKMVQDV
jgi:uncharacterized membrane protein (DUF106 family)